MINSRKTKHEMLQELESIKYLLQSDASVSLLEARLAQQAAFDLTATDLTATDLTAADASSADQTDNSNHQHRERKANTPAANATQQSAPHYNTAQTLIAHSPSFSVQALISSIVNSNTVDSHTVNAHTSSRDKNASSANAQSAHKKTANTAADNPFLPPHIRERMLGNAPAGTPAPRKVAKASLSRQQQVNRLMQQMRPKLERELRQILLSLNSVQLEQLLQEVNPQE